MAAAPHTMDGRDWMAFLQRNKQQRSTDDLMAVVTGEETWDKRLGAATLLGKDVYGKFCLEGTQGYMMFRAGHAVLSFSRLEFGMAVVVMREFAALPKTLLDINGTTIRNMDHISELVESVAAGNAMDRKNGQMALLMVAGRDETGAGMLTAFKRPARASVIMIDYGDADERSPLRIMSMVKD